MLIFNSSKAHHLMRQNNCVFGAKGDAAGGRAAAATLFLAHGYSTLRHMFSF
jgi:hypothetical protein